MLNEKEYNEFIQNTNIERNTENKCICPICNKVYSLYGIKNHIKYHFGFTGYCSKENGKTSWNKGLTKENSPIVRKGIETLKKHIKEGLVIPVQTGKPHTDEEKKKISESMKKAHKEGRAHNIGSSRWNNKPSYPEQFIMNVIENELVDKNYKREYPFHKYSFDFAWEHKKKYIEIDGEQHIRFEDYHERDMKKDELAKSEGWNGLRILWKDMFNDTKTYIKKIKDFIDE